MGFAEDLCFGFYNGDSESIVALSSVEYSSSASYYERGSAFEDCPSPSRHNLATNSGIQEDH
ncbi:Protein CSF1 [Bienertia sinuspersici]